MKETGFIIAIIGSFDETAIFQNYDIEHKRGFESRLSFPFQQRMVFIIDEQQYLEIISFSVNRLHTLKIFVAVIL